MNDYIISSDSDSNKIITKSIKSLQITLGAFIILCLIF